MCAPCERACAAPPPFRGGRASKWGKFVNKVVINFHTTRRRRAFAFLCLAAGASAFAHGQTASSLSLPELASGQQDLQPRHP